MQRYKEIIGGSMGLTESQKETCGRVVNDILTTRSEGENSPSEECPKCGRGYNDIDFDYQACSKCGWNVDKEDPSDYDYLNGDADILTGEWM